MADGESVQFIINNKVEIIWDDGDYKSNIEDVQDRYFAISIPIKEGQYIPLRAGEKVEVLYFNDNNIYKFFSKVLGRKIDGIPVVLLSKPDKVQVIQRRRFVRISHIVPAKYAKTTKEAKIPGEGTVLGATLLDISAGGVRIRISEEVSRGEFVEVYFPLSGEEFILKGELVRVIKDKDGKYACGVSFIDLRERDRDKIVRFIFQLMREQRKKALEEE